MNKLIIGSVLLTMLCISAAARTVDTGSYQQKKSTTTTQKSPHVQRGQNLRNYHANHAKSPRSVGKNSQKHTRIRRPLAGYGNTHSLKTASHAHPRKGGN